MARAKETDWWKKAALIVKRLGIGAESWLAGKWSSYAKSKALHHEATELAPDPQLLTAVKERLQLVLQGKPQAKRPLRAEEREWIEGIQRQTAADNRNNVTRTAAYWRLFRQWPELHWAFLAHMVSRNGGWWMTDLKGELLPRLLTAEQAEAIFRMLERANALIFQDAYPQLLLYAESRRQRQPLFHLLGELHVSAFMQPIWERFWAGRDSVLLTVALIVNEQHYIEGRVVQDPYYKKHVLDTLFYQAQSLLQLNQVVFPRGDGAYAGLVLEDFGNLNERIEFGKKLYAILFGIQPVSQGAQRFAASQRHTGSRADAWSHLFSPVRHGSAGAAYTPKLDGCRLRPGAEPLYSPALEHAWPDRPVEPPARYDWFTDRAALDYLTGVRAPFPADITAEYCAGLAKLELAVLAGDAFTEK